MDRKAAEQGHPLAKFELNHTSETPEQTLFGGISRLFGVH